MATLALLICNPKQKLVVHWHSDIIRQKFALFFYRPLQEMLLRRSDKVIVTSKNYLETSQHLANYKAKAEVVPIGTNAELISNDNKLQELRAKYKEKVIIFSLGRHVYYKGFDYLIESAKYLDSNYVIVIGGDGPLTSTLIKQVNDNRLNDRVFFTGRIPNSEISSYFEVCDIFCLSSIERTEAFGVVLLEAMSLGKPLVATNIPGSGVNWVNKNNETGLNVAPQNAEELANAFIKIGTNKKLHQQFSVQSKLRYQSKFTREAMVTQLINLYSEILRDK
jgi:rhamnosyl/mannosyltransferase